MKTFFGEVEMKRKHMSLILAIAAVFLFTQACLIGPLIPQRLPAVMERILPQEEMVQPAPTQETLPAVIPQVPQVAPELPAAPPPAADSLLEAYQGTLTAIYEHVNPSVVNIRVAQSQASPSQETPEIPFPFHPQIPEFPPSQGEGSGFVWDKQGHIVTNYHVVAGASRIEVTFWEGTSVLAEMVGHDHYSDLAVLRVNLPPDSLQPVIMADSDQVRVGQLAIAIGNPFGLNGTMTVGIVSALGRSLPVEQFSAGGGFYTIPDIIQTDAPINPGNSGGVLLNDRGEVIGVTTAISSPVRANAGVGYAVPAAIVEKVVPSLIEKGYYDHPWLGVSIMTMTPDIAVAMGMEPSQRGAMVSDVLPNSPAQRAGLNPGRTEAEIDGRRMRIGGDIIIALEGESIRSNSDLIALLARNTRAGETVSLTVLRNGESIDIDITLAARPKD
jgi:S1-C subfamily serine protease